MRVRHTVDDEAGTVVWTAANPTMRPPPAEALRLRAPAGGRSGLRVIAHESLLIVLGAALVLLGVMVGARLDDGPLVDRSPTLGVPVVPEVAGR